tara:strand:+ start:19 stop:198 length:180 start_codon:yes stop_codon:yes gene_type:complete
MASIQDLYKNSDFAKLPNKGGDKTPIELDGGKDLRKESNLERARGGKANLEKYSNTVKR